MDLQSYTYLRNSLVTSFAITSVIPLRSTLRVRAYLFHIKILNLRFQPNLFDKFEPPNRHYSDPMYMSLNNLYNVEISKTALYEEQPTSMGIAMQQLIRSQLKYRHDCLYESMITKINLFDDDILALDAERNDIRVRIKFLDLFALSLEDEMIILNDFDLLENEYLHVVHKKTMIQNEKVNQVKCFCISCFKTNRIVQSLFKYF